MDCKLILFTIDKWDLLKCRYIVSGRRELIFTIFKPFRITSILRIKNWDWSLCWVYKEKFIEFGELYRVKFIEWNICNINTHTRARIISLILCKNVMHILHCNHFYCHDIRNNAFSCKHHILPDTRKDPRLRSWRS